MAETKDLKSFKSGMRFKNAKKHVRHKQRHSILEALGVGTGALVLMGSGGSPENAIQNLKDFQYGGLSNIGYNLQANINLPSAVKVAEPIVGAWIAEKILKKMHLNVNVGKRWKL